MLDPVRKGITRCDEHGDKVLLKKQSNGRWRISMIKPRARATHLPGVDMYLRRIAEAGCSPWRLEEEPRPPARPSYLRLVVDNT
jgi:hypothetical protein